MRISNLPVIFLVVLFSTCSMTKKSALADNSKVQVNSTTTNESLKQDQQVNTVANEVSTDTPKTSEPIVGKWRDVKVGTVVQFFKEVTVLMDDSAAKQRITGKYKQLDENNLKLTLDLPMSRPAIIKCKIVGNNLELGKPDGSAGMSEFSKIQE